MTARTILYLAAAGENGTSQMRGEALRRCGHGVQIVDITTCIPKNIWFHRLHRALGYRLLDRAVCEICAAAARGRKFDVAWVDNGALVGPRTMAFLHRVAAAVINYNLDDPTGSRDGNQWLTFKRMIPRYDLLITVRRETEQELLARGAPRVYRVFRSYDEILHAPSVLTEAQRAHWRSEVLFAGTWMPERGAFFREMLNRGVPVTIYGDYWNRAPEWPALASVWRGPTLYGRDYALAIQSAKICIGMVSKGNRDLHTQRSAEIPAIGSLFCAERTVEHEQLYRHEIEAIFWTSAADCADHCLHLLAGEAKRAAIASAGSKRVRELRLGNEAVLGGALERYWPAGARRPGAAEAN